MSVAWGSRAILRLPQEPFKVKGSRRHCHPPLSAVTVVFGTCKSTVEQHFVSFYIDNRLKAANHEFKNKRHRCPNSKATTVTIPL